MKGWKTRTFTEKSYFHHRKIGTGTENGHLAVKFRQGEKDYYLGGHPVWQIFRSVFQMGSRPVVIGGLALLSGYLSAWLRRVERPLSDDLIRFHRAEQMRRLRSAITGPWRRNSAVRFDPREHANREKS
jgi:hypothetical protein